MKVLEPFADVPELGYLALIEVLDYFDGPRLVALESPAGLPVIGYWQAEQEDGDDWLFVPLKQADYGRLRAGKLPLRDALMGPILGHVALARIAPDWAVLSSTWLSPVEVERLGLSLPSPGDRLKPAMMPTAPASLNVEEAANAIAASLESEARRIGRERLYIRVAQAAHQVRGRVLAELLVAVQHLVESLARVGPRRAPLDVLAGFQPTSFSLNLVSAEQEATLFGDDNVAEGLDELFRLISLQDNEASVIAYLQKLPRRTASRYKRLVNVVSETGHTFEFAWGSSARSSPIDRAQRLTYEAATKLRGLLESEEAKEREPFTVVGTIETVAKRLRKFEFDSGDALYKGRIAEGAWEAASTAKISGQYQATLRDKTRIHPVTGEEHVSWELLALTTIPDREH